jgi:phytanoyl-CoA dioxygenase PhyH
MTAALLSDSAQANGSAHADSADPALVSSLADTLETDGVVRLPPLVSDHVLCEMQRAFSSRLQHQRWNNCDGYERNERLRLMVPDVLLLSQGFVDLALHPLVKALLNEYLGPAWSLCEAKGWQSLPTKYDFHGWHGDMWYDQTAITDRIPREVKLCFYLSNVTSGAFRYIKGSHGRRVPGNLTHEEVERLPLERMAEFLAPAGTAVLFDTSGIHRQAIPILEPRSALFYNYHDPSVPLQHEDVEYYRYHPLLLNAAFLGDMTPENMRILGMGDKTHYQPYFARRRSHPRFHDWLTAAYNAKLTLGELSGRVFARLRRLCRRS